MSGKMVNIGGDPNDVNYRYKMPAMTTKIEGRGNGIKTVLMNIADVAKHMHTEPSYATKFFGMEVGALSNYDTKRNVGIVHGVHQTKDLQTMLQKFIREFILCQKCKMPELQFKIHTKKNVLLQKCAACGWKGSNSSNHKVKTYIINHPPKKRAKTDVKKPGKPGSRKPGSRKPGRKSKGGDAKPEEKEPDYTELGWDNDEVWSVDTSEKAVAERKAQEMATLANQKGKNAKSSDSSTSTSASSSPPPKSGSKASPAHILRKFISADRTSSEILDEIRRISLARNFDQKKKLQLAIEALCKLDTMERFVASLTKYKAIMATFTTNANDAKVFFGVFEEFVLRRNPEAFLDRVYVLLRCLYDEDIVEEDDLLAWADLETDKAVIVDQDEAERIREKAAPFIKWLRESEEESGEEESSEE